MEAEKRGYALWHYTPSDLIFRDRKVLARAHQSLIWARTRHANMLRSALREYYPAALGEAVRHTAALVGDVPILVTENGIATADDVERVEYTAQALAGLRSAIDDGVDASTAPLVTERESVADGEAESFREGTRDHDVSQNIDALLRHIQGTAPFTVLDFGCGPGRDLQTFTRMGHVAVGLDGSEEFDGLFCENIFCMRE